MDNELLLFDRIQVIQETNKKYDLEHNAYLSFSGGKDSTILHHLLDMALPNNRIPRVFVDTGIEYQMIREFVIGLAKNDERIVIVKPSQNIKQTLERVGYPFKSKEHSLRIEQFNKGKNSNFIYKYINGKNKDGTELKGNRFVCPQILKYQFEEKGKYNYSNLCCYELKKKPMHKWEKENNRYIAITGMRAEEGGQRARLGCIITNKKTNKIIRFHPLIKVNEEWEEWFIERESSARTIVLSALQFQKNRMQRLSVLIRPTRTIGDYGTLYA